MHPKNKFHRNQIGNKKSKKRAGLLKDYLSNIMYNQHKRKLRNSTKLCNCSACRNQRRNKWNTEQERMTLQERKDKEKVEFELERDLDYVEFQERCSQRGHYLDYDEVVKM